MSSDEGTPPSLIGHCLIVSKHSTLHNKQTVLTPSVRLLNSISHIISILHLSIVSNHPTILLGGLLMEHLSRHIILPNIVRILQGNDIKQLLALHILAHPAQQNLVMPILHSMLDGVRQSQRTPRRVVDDAFREINEVVVVRVFIVLASDLGAEIRGLGLDRRLGGVLIAPLLRFAMLLREGGDVDGSGQREAVRPVDVVVDSGALPVVREEADDDGVPARAEGEIGEQLLGADGEVYETEIDVGSGAVAVELVAWDIV